MEMQDRSDMHFKPGTGMVCGAADVQKRERASTGAWYCYGRAQRMQRCSESSLLYGYYTQWRAQRSIYMR
jgi:hypothetical protein